MQRCHDAHCVLNIELMQGMEWWKKQAEYHPLEAYGFVAGPPEASRLTAGDWRILHLRRSD